MGIPLIDCILRFVEIRKESTLMYLIVLRFTEIRIGKKITCIHLLIDSQLKLINLLFLMSFH